MIIFPLCERIFIYFCNFYSADLEPYLIAATDPVVFPIKKQNVVFPKNPEKVTKAEKLNYFKHLGIPTHKNAA